MCVRLCGEAMAITEPFVPNPCERCGHPTRVVNVPDQPDRPTPAPG